MANYYYSGQGSLYIAQRSVLGAPLGFIPVGNVPELTLNIETTKLEHKESESGQRLVDLTIVKEKKGTFEFKLENLNLDNLAMALWGTKGTVASGSVTTNGDPIVVPFDAVAGMRFPLKYPKPTAVVVKDAADAITYTLNTDYTVDAKNGVIILTTGGAILTAAAAASVAGSIIIHATYAYASHTKVDAFTTTAAPERWMRFEGINTVDDSAVIVDLFKAQFDPMTGYGLINEELGAVSMKGSVLADPLQLTGSKFFRQINV